MQSLIVLFSLLTAFESSLAATLSSSYRKDYYLPQYIEFGVPEPVDGGRLHVVGLATASGTPTTIILNGTTLNLNVGVPLDEWVVDWARAEPLTGFTIGAQFWVSFHSRRTAWDALASSHNTVSLSILDAAGHTLASGEFGVHVPEAPVTYVTTSGNRSSLLIFVRGAMMGSGSTLSRLLFNGADVTSLVPSNLQAVPANETVLWSLPTSAIGGPAAVAAGSVWTVEIDWVEAPRVARTAAGGLLLPEFYPIETWEHSSDCPFPTINDAAYAQHRAHGIDTFFTEYKLDSACNTTITAVDLVNTLAPKYDFWVLPSAEDPKILGQVTDASRLAGWFLADEDDTIVDDKARNLLAAVNRARALWPSVPTYAGGASNRYTGAYSGITDVKGMDAYIGACAPHYIPLAPPPRYSFDYLANTRANHAPGPTWLYSQGFEDGWDGLGKTVNRQATPAEIAVQVISVGAAGAKGMMLFETQLKYVVGETAPAWATLGTLCREMGAVRELLRAGDPTGAVRALDANGHVIEGVIVEGTLSARALVVHAINIATTGDPGCLVICAVGLPCHITFAPTTVDALTILLPVGFTPVDSFELFNATVLPGSLPTVPGDSPRTIVFKQFMLGAEGPGSGPTAAAPSDVVVRTLVFASDSALRSEITAALRVGGNVSVQIPAALPVGGKTAVSNASLWRTAKDTSDRLSPQPQLQWSPNAPTPQPGVNSTSVTLAPDSKFQTIFGFGGAITEAAVSVFLQLDTTAQEALIADLYGENEDGTSLRYTSGRLTIGSCDFSLGYYNYNEKVNDTEMLNFTIAHDEAAIIPFILRAQNATAAAGRPLRFISSPWSPPAWMKTNNQMSCFPLGPIDCALIPEYQPAYALYTSKYLSAYAAAGVDIWAITVQNEPQPQTGTLTYEGMWFPFTAELEFIAEYLGPQLRADHPDVKIFIFDHNQADAYWYAAPILADPIASEFVAGTAIHWYSGPDWSALDLLNADFPEKFILATESTVGREDNADFFKPSAMIWDHGEYYGTFMITDLVHNVIGFLDWNILLNQHGAPDHGDPTGELCEGLIVCGSDAMMIADTSVNPPIVYKQAFYWYFAHLSRFIPPGSIRIGSTLQRPASGATPIIGVAFTTPDGGTALVLQNAQNTTEHIDIEDPRAGFLALDMPPRSIVTITWSV